MRFGLLWLLAIVPFMSVLAEPPAATDAGALAVGDFFKNPSLHDVILSPDGKYVAEVNRTDPQHEYISIIDLAQETSTDVVATADDQEYFSQVHWVSGNSFTYYDHIGPNEDRVVGAKLSLTQAGLPQAKLTVWPNQFWLVASRINDGNDNGDDVILGSRDNGITSLYRVDINSDPDKLGKKQEIDEIAKRYTSLVMAKGRLALFTTQDDDGTRHFFRRVSMPGGDTWEEYKKISDRKAVFYPKIVAPHGHDLYVLSNIGRDTIGYFEYDPDTDKFVRTIYANDDADVTGFDYDPLTDSFIYLKWLEGTDPQFEVLDERAKVQAPALRDAFPGQQAVPSAISENGQEMLVYVYSDTNSGAYYAFDVQKRRAELLGAEYSWLDPALMAPVKSGSLKTPDGFIVSYLITVPKTGRAPYPLVVVPHGGPIGVFNVNSFDPETQLLVSRGYAVLSVNYRGSGASGKKFEEAGNHQWGRKIEDDIEQVVHTVIHTSPVDPDRICIYGASYGGYSALMSVIRDPALFKCAASYAGVTDLPLLYDTTDVQFDKQVQKDLADIIGDPTTDAAQLRAVSPVYLADKIRRPVFLAQGGEDTRVDMEQAYRLKLVMETLKKPVEFKFYPYETHGFKYSDDETDFYLMLLDFLGRNIASNRPVAPPPVP